MANHDVQSEANQVTPEVFQQVLEASQSGVLLLNREGRFVYANPAAQEILRRPWSSFANLPYQDLDWAPTDLQGRPMAPEELPFAQVLATGQPIDRTRYAIHWPDGSRRILWTSASPMPMPPAEMEHVLVWLGEITDRLAKRRDPERTSEKFQLAQDAAGFGLWEWDVQRDVAYWDRVTWEILGYGPEKAVTPFNFQQWVERVHPEDYAVIAPQIPDLLREQKGFVWDIRYQRADGGWHWLEQRGKVIQRDSEGNPLLATGTLVDIQKFKDVEHLLHQILTHIEEMVWICTPGEMLYMNPAYERLWGDGLATLKKDPRAFLDLVHPDDQPKVFAALEKEHQQPGSFDELYRVVRPGGGVRWIHARAYLVDEETARTAGTAVDVTELQEARLKLEKMASTDYLTGAWNRQRFERKFNDVLHQVRTHDAKAGLILLDVDYFKKINDCFGHQVGDDVLREMTLRLQARLRRQDRLARWGGEEFVILLPETGIDDSVRAAERLRLSIAEREFRSAGHVTASFGVTQLDPSDSGTHIGFRRADLALYEAKHQGRNRVASIFP